ncbi:hypothetical protein WN51_10247 [Melipona quadrifasciata]|uniref:Uncharacterized protein n=1 Tax=Melipona quadrifasciata TaxID=166423 RepID=A0A0M9A4N7_9HYME|nr:hypothetical protein WN51_10247 [Melipona quadrifasciata]
MEFGMDLVGSKGLTSANQPPTKQPNLSSPSGGGVASCGKLAGNSCKIVRKQVDRDAKLLSTQITIQQATQVREQKKKKKKKKKNKKKEKERKGGKAKQQPLSGSRIRSSGVDICEILASVLHVLDVTWLEALLAIFKKSANNIIVTFFKNPISSNQEPPRKKEANRLVKVQENRIKWGFVQDSNNKCKFENSGFIKLVLWKSSVKIICGSRILFVRQKVSNNRAATADIEREMLRKKETEKRVERWSIMQPDRVAYFALATSGL